MDEECVHPYTMHPSALGSSSCAPFISEDILLFYVLRVEETKKYVYSSSWHQHSSMHVALQNEYTWWMKYIAWEISIQCSTANLVCPAALALFYSNGQLNISQQCAQVAAWPGSEVLWPVEPGNWLFPLVKPQLNYCVHFGSLSTTWVDQLCAEECSKAGEGARKQDMRSGWGN